MQLSLGGWCVPVAMQEDNGDIKHMRGSEANTMGQKTVFELFERSSSAH